MDKLILTKELEKKSKYGIPYEKSRKWFWKDDVGNIGVLSAVTEMEALDRLREAFDQTGRITWISEKEFNTFT